MVICREYSSEWKPGDEPYYPVNDEKNGKLTQSIKSLLMSRKTLFLADDMRSTSITTWIRSCGDIERSQQKAVRENKLGDKCTERKEVKNKLIVIKNKEMRSREDNFKR